VLRASSLSASRSLQHLDQRQGFVGPEHTAAVLEQSEHLCTPRGCMETEGRTIETMHRRKGLHPYPGDFLLVLFSSNHWHARPLSAQAGGVWLHACRCIGRRKCQSAGLQVHRLQNNIKGQIVPANLLYSPLSPKSDASKFVPLVNHQGRVLTDAKAFGVKEPLIPGWSLPYHLSLKPGAWIF